MFSSQAFWPQHRFLAGLQALKRSGADNITGRTPIVVRGRGVRWVTSGSAWRRSITKRSVGIGHAGTHRNGSATSRPAKEFSACAELRRLAIELICANVLGLPPGSQTKRDDQDYGFCFPIGGRWSPPGANILAPRPATVSGPHSRADRRTAATSRQRWSVENAYGSRGGLAHLWEALFGCTLHVMAGFIVYAHMAEPCAVFRTAVASRAAATKSGSTRLSAISMEVCQTKASMNVVLESAFTARAAGLRQGQAHIRLWGISLRQLDGLSRVVAEQSRPGDLR